MGSAVRRRCPRGLDPPPEGRMPQPAGAREGVPPAGSSACGPVPEGLSVGAIGWSSFAVPRCAGASPPWPGARFAPSSLTRLHPGVPPFWGALPGPRRGFDRPRRVVPSPGGVDRAIWLILPVVICLSQRLSHACLSISNLYCETANGSLNQLSFI